MKAFTSTLVLCLACSFWQVSIQAEHQLPATSLMNITRFNESHDA